MLPCHVLLFTIGQLATPVYSNGADAYVAGHHLQLYGVTLWGVEFHRAPQDDTYITYGTGSYLCLAYKEVSACKQLQSGQEYGLIGGEQTRLVTYYTNDRHELRMKVQVVHGPHPEADFALLAVPYVSLRLLAYVDEMYIVWYRGHVATYNARTDRFYNSQMLPVMAIDIKWTDNMLRITDIDDRVTAYSYAPGL